MAELPEFDGTEEERRTDYMECGIPYQNISTFSLVGEYRFRLKVRERQFLAVLERLSSE